MNPLATFDYIVAGGGTAGCIVAARLAEDPACTVALLEAGPSDENDPRVLILHDWMNLLGSELDFDYTIEPQARGNSRIRHSRARVLGGCSSHNGCVSFRAPDFDLRRWVEQGAAGWGPDDLRPYFDRVLAKAPVQPPPENPVNAAFLQAAQQAGLPRARFNQGELAEGAGLFDIAVRDGVRLSSSVAYLHPLADRPPNLRVFTGTPARRILFDDSRNATGVLTGQGALAARREIVVACGAFDSPKLLLLSGVGPAGHLRGLGIPVVADRPGVGEHLLDHPEGVVVFESRRPVPDRTANFWDAGLFARSNAAEPHPDIMCHFGLVPFDLNTRPLGYPTAEHGFSITPNVPRARSQGTVRLRSADPDEPPAIDFRYFTDPDGYDERILLAGIRLARRVAAQPALQAWIERELAPGPAVQSDAELSEYARLTSNTVYHPAGTCRMGPPADPLAVVDPALRVLGVQRLRVADASVFPSLTTVNPVTTVMAVGEKCADLIRNNT
jgi:choline dehydrogenase